MNINELVEKAYRNALKKGFWEDTDFESKICLKLAASDSIEWHLTSEEINAIGNRLMLIVGEVAEAQEGLRKRNWDNFREELADVAIRLADLCGGLNIDLEYEIMKKMDKNKDRPYKHGKAF